MTRVADRFRLDESPHAEGASGVVWGALDETTGRRVAETAPTESDLSLPTTKPQPCQADPSAAKAA